MELFTLEGESRGSTVTAADGSYAFSADPGTYYLELTEPDGHCFTAQDRDSAKWARKNAMGSLIS